MPLICACPHVGFMIQGVSYPFLKSPLHSATSSRKRAQSSASLHSRDSVSRSSSESPAAEPEGRTTGKGRGQIYTDGVMPMESFKIRDTLLCISTGSVVNFTGDAIVNAANCGVCRNSIGASEGLGLRAWFGAGGVGGSGVDGAIYQ